MTDLEDGFYWAREFDVSEFQTIMIKGGLAYILDWEGALAPSSFAEIDPRRIVREGVE